MWEVNFQKVQIRLFALSSARVPIPIAIPKVPHSMDLFTTACLVAVLVAWKIAGRLLRRHFFRKLTVVDDLHNLGLPRAPHQRLRGTAVICGGR